MTSLNRKLLLMAMAVSMTGACDMLDVTDPTKIEERDTETPAGAHMMYVFAAMSPEFYLTFAALMTALLTDEMIANPSVGNVTGMSEWEMMDRRLSQLPELQSSGGFLFGNIADARRHAAAALRHQRLFGAPSTRDERIAEMYLVRGQAETIMAEAFCPGFPLNEFDEGRVVLGRPMSAADVFGHALAQLDSATVLSDDGSVLANRIRMARARALLGLGRFSDAAAAAAPVPTGFSHSGHYGTNAGSNSLFYNCCGIPTFTPANRAGGNGLDFISADDPRVRVTFLTKGHDGVTDVYRIDKYSSQASPFPSATGIEARLIEAEGALNAGDPGWLTILNALRSTQISPALPPLEDPGVEAARVDLLFRERAFWLYATGRRLGDLRRLVAHYGRQAADVFPSGAYHLGGEYGTGTSLPFAIEVEASHNPAITGCTGP